MEQRRDARRQTTKYGNGYIGDNLARKLEDPYVPEYARPEAQRRRRTHTSQRRRARISAFDVLWIAVGSVIIITAVLVMLSSINTTNTLNSAIANVEAQVNTLKADNDAMEYAIESSVDLDYVGQIATTELGMVRSSASQIVTYKPQETEYIQQVAEIPTN